MTDQTKHTPGPWFTHREGFSTVYVEARIGGGQLQEVAACGPTSKGVEQQDGNARLIAAAPDLLQALIHLEHNARKSGAEMGLALVVARDAIAKATGSGNV